jgi:hypothetical protein
MVFFFVVAENWNIRDDNLKKNANLLKAGELKRRGITRYDAELLLSQGLRLPEPRASTGRKHPIKSANVKSVLNDLNSKIPPMKKVPQRDKHGCFLTDQRSSNSGDKNEMESSKIAAKIKSPNKRISFSFEEQEFDHPEFDNEELDSIVEQACRICDEDSVEQEETHTLAKNMECLKENVPGCSTNDETSKTNVDINMNSSPSICRTRGRKLDTRDTSQVPVGKETVQSPAIKHSSCLSNNQRCSPRLRGRGSASIVSVGSATVSKGLSVQVKTETVEEKPVCRHSPRLQAQVKAETKIETQNIKSEIEEVECEIKLVPEENSGDNIVDGHKNSLQSSQISQSEHLDISSSGTLELHCDTESIQGQSCRQKNKILKNVQNSEVSRKPRTRQSPRLHVRRDSEGIRSCSSKTEKPLAAQDLTRRLNQELNMSSAENGITGIDDSFIDVCSFSEEQQGDSLAHRLKSEITQEPVDNMFESFESIIKNVTPPRKVDDQNEHHSDKKIPESKIDNFNRSISDQCLKLLNKNHRERKRKFSYSITSSPDTSPDKKIPKLTIKMRRDPILETMEESLSTVKRLEDELESKMKCELTHSKHHRKDARRRRNSGKPPNSPLHTSPSQNAPSTFYPLSNNHTFPKKLRLKLGDTSFSISIPQPNDFSQVQNS